MIKILSSTPLENETQMGHVSEEINASICLRAHRNPINPRAIFAKRICSGIWISPPGSDQGEEPEGEKEETGEASRTKGDPRLSYVFARLFITVYYFLLSMESRIVGGRGGPRRISKTVPDWICIFRPVTRVWRPITGPINCGSALFSSIIRGSIQCFLSRSSFRVDSLFQRGSAYPFLRDEGFNAATLPLVRIQGKFSSVSSTIRKLSLSFEWC